MTQMALLMVGLLAAADRGPPIAGSPCTGKEDLLALKGKWTVRTDVGRGTNIPAGAASEVDKRIDRIGKLFHAAYPEPRGMDAAGYRDLDSPQLFENGPFPYSYRSLYLAWSCNPRTHKLQLGGETATWAYAFVNHLTWFVEPQKTLRVQGQPTYLLTKRVGSFRGLPEYEGIHNQSSNTGQTFSRAILVSRTGRSPLKPVTRKQFLEGYLAALDAQGQAMIAEIEKSSVDPGRKDTLVKQRRAQLSTLSATATGRLSRMSPSEAEQQAFLTGPNLVQFKDFTAEAQGGRALVRLDRSAIDASLPRFVPQFVVVYWRWQKNVPSENFRAEFERRFDSTALEGLLGH
jgi:hypothetical protein